MDFALALVSSAFAAVIAAYLASRKVREDLEARYDTELRGLRLKVYSELWRSLEPLAKYSPPVPVTGGVLVSLSQSLRAWYFTSGGMFLSERARDAYFALQQALVGATGVRGSSAEATLAPEAFESIRSKGSLLRTELARDIGTRRRLIAVEDWRKVNQEAAVIQQEQRVGVLFVHGIGSRRKVKRSATLPVRSLEIEAYYESVRDQVPVPTLVPRNRSTVY